MVTRMMQLLHVRSAIVEDKKRNISYLGSAILLFDYPRAIRVLPARMQYWIV